jgi:hypothetical protein
MQPPNFQTFDAVINKLYNVSKNLRLISVMLVEVFSLVQSNREKIGASPKFLFILVSLGGVDRYF